MKGHIYYKMLWNKFGYNVEMSVDITRWLIGFSWVSSRGQCSHIHFNIGPVAVTFSRSQADIIIKTMGISQCDKLN